MKEYVAPTSEVRRITNGIEQEIKRIDKLWQKNGFTGKELAFWSGNRNNLHNMLYDILENYRIKRYMK